MNAFIETGGTVRLTKSDTERVFHGVSANVNRVFLTPTQEDRAFPTTTVKQVMEGTCETDWIFQCQLSCLLIKLYSILNVP
jgi:hypothetical protein